MAKTQTKSPTFAILPTRAGGLQDVFFLYVIKVRGDGPLEETLKWAYNRPAFPLEQRDNLIKLLTTAGMTVRYFDLEEKKWMDSSTSGGLEPAPGNRDGSWNQPDLEVFKKDYLGVRFGASVAA